MPKVPEELEAMMAATFRFVGLDHLLDGGPALGGGSACARPSPPEAVPPEHCREPEPEMGGHPTSDWERAPISELCGSFEAATVGAREALREATAAHQAAVRQFEAEQLSGLTISTEEDGWKVPTF